MNQQQAATQINQQILAASTNTQHQLAPQIFRCAAQRPTQRLPHAHIYNFGTGNAVSKTQAGNFNFREFWHGNGRAGRLVLLTPTEFWKDTFALNSHKPAKAGSRHSIIMGL